MTFDDEKWNAIVAQWERDDNEETADELESGADAMALADPKTWADVDQPAQGAQGLAREATQGLRLRPEVPNAVPPTVGGGEKSAAPSFRGEPTALPSDPKQMNWAQLRDALQNAQARASQTRAGESMRANIIPGYRPDLEGGAAQIAQARAPLDMAKEQQGFEQREAASRAKNAMDDPHSLQSQKAREAWRSFGLTTPPGFDNWTANDIQRHSSGAQAQRKAAADLDAEARKRQLHERERGEDQARHERERAQDLEHRKLSHEDAMANAAATRALAASAQSKLPASEAVALGGADAAVKAIDALGADWDKLASEFGSGVKQFVPGTDANLYMPSLNTTTQVVGKYLEGGKLTDADVPKYRAMMPQPQDTEAQKRAKVNALKRLIENKRAEESKSLKGAGYRVPDSDVAPSAPIPPRGPPKGIPPDAFFDDGAWWYEENGKLMRHTEGG